MPQRELHQLDLAEHENLKLARDRFDVQMLGRSKMTGSGIVNQRVEITGFGERGVKCVFDRGAVGEIETNRVQSRQFWDVF